VLTSTIVSAAPSKRVRRGLGVLQGGQAVDSTADRRSTQRHHPSEYVGGSVSCRRWGRLRPRGLVVGRGQLTAMYRDQLEKRIRVHEVKGNLSARVYVLSDKMVARRDIGFHQGRSIGIGGPGARRH
jgi:hypothetical protein